MIGWPLLAAILSWGAATLLSGGVPVADLSQASAGLLMLLASLAGLAGLLALIRTPDAPPTLPYVGMAAGVAALVASTPFEPSTGTSLPLFLVTAPWRYALTPLVVHFALAVGWSHRARYWFGLVIGWYLLHVALFIAAASGLAAHEAPLHQAVDATALRRVLEPVGALTAIVALAVATASPLRRQSQRRALGWAFFAVTAGFGPILMTQLWPILAQPLDGPMTVARLALPLLALFGLGGVLALPFGSPAKRDLLAHQHAQRLLEERDLTHGLRGLAEGVREIFEAEGVAIRVLAPSIMVTAGEMRSAPSPADAALTPDTETIDERRGVIAPIGRAGDPLAEIRIMGRFPGAFGRRERQWLTAFLGPVGAAVRARRREAAAEERVHVIAQQASDVRAALLEANRLLPEPPHDDGMAVPPPVDAREVLTQLSEGVSGITRHGAMLDETSTATRDNAGRTSDEVARAIDALVALGGDLARLAAHGEEIAASNQTVSGVAFRTNLLANNAALEATRAGTAGRTFGVLAEEIRRLADETAATSVAIGSRTGALSRDVAQVGANVAAVRVALASAIRESEATEEVARRLGEIAGALDGAVRSLRPAVEEASAVAKRRSARDHHLTATMERFLDERVALAHAIVAHRDALTRLAEAMQRLSASGRGRRVGTALGGGHLG